MPAKAKIAQIRCPKDKWTEVYGTSDEEPNTMSMFKGTDIDGKREALLRQAEHLKKESEKLIEAFSIVFDGEGDSTTMYLGWGNTIVSVPVKG